MRVERCRGCGSAALEALFSLGDLPYANSFPVRSPCLPKHRLALVICADCRLVQLDEFPDLEELYSNYIWETASSSSVPLFLKDAAAGILSTGKIDKVIEIASNDGTFLSAFKELGCETVGVEPARNLATASSKKGLHIINDYISEGFTDKYPDLRGQFDLLIARNVLAHLTDIQSFLNEASELLRPDGRCWIEFHDGDRILQDLQFDSIYHEHQSYITAAAISNIVEKSSFTLIDIEQGFVGGGSLVVTLGRGQAESEHSLVEISRLKHNDHPWRWNNFKKSVDLYKDGLIELLDSLSKSHSLIGFGASARSTTFSNFTNSKSYVDMILDNATAKQGRYWSGSSLKIQNPASLTVSGDSIIIVFAWNFFDEIKSQMRNQNFDGKFLQILPTQPLIRE